MDITVGNFYAQFGSGMILRAYEERNLGYDNAFDGIRIKYSPINGVYITSLLGRQRIFFEKAEGLVRGLDGEISLNESLTRLSESTTRIILGASFVSKYQADLNSQYVLPENVASWASRINLNHGKWHLVLNMSTNTMTHLPQIIIFSNQGMPYYFPVHTQKEGLVFRWQQSV